MDKTGTVDKPDPMNDVFLEFPRAMRAVALITKFGARKHAPRGWQTFEPRFGIKYHMSKVGRHILDRELDGEVNNTDGGNLHMAAIVWNALATLENICKLREADEQKHPVVEVSRDTSGADVTLSEDRVSAALQSYATGHAKKKPMAELYRERVEKAGY